MERRAKVELFEQMRREYEHGVGTVRGVAGKFGVHRRMVRLALGDARATGAEEAGAKAAAAGAGEGVDRGDSGGGPEGAAEEESVA